MVVLTGLADEHLGAEAVRAGAQDYLVKGQVDGSLLHRVIRYAVERRPLEEVQRQLQEAQIVARENSRLERGLLPSPLLADPRLTVATRYRPGGGQSLLGGDFYDVVETADGWVHALVGDVCGRGPDEAALGVCLRVAWRTMVLAGRPMDETLSAVEQVLEHERQQDRLFTTAVRAVGRAGPDARAAAPGRPPAAAAARRRRGCGSSAPRRACRSASARPRAGGAARSRSATEWSVLMYTDGLIEGRIGAGTERLGSDGLITHHPDLLGLAPAGRPGGSGATSSCWRAWSSGCASSTAASWTTTWPCWPWAARPGRRRDRPDRGEPTQRPGQPPGWPGAAALAARRLRPPRGRRLAAGRLVAVGIVIMTLFSVAAIVIGALALTGLGSARSQVVSKLDPASFQASQLEVALLNQETGVRGYALSGQPVFLQPYALGLASQQHGGRPAAPGPGRHPRAQAELRRVLSAASDWRAGYAIPVMASVRATGKPPASPGPAARQGRLRQHAGRPEPPCRPTSRPQRRQALTRLSDAADTLDGACIGIAVGLLLIVIMLTIGVRRTTIGPLARLAADARQVADGDFEHELSQRGPREVRDLGADVDSMRERILSELSAVQAANTSLEQRTHGPAALELRARAVRLRGLARPAGAAAQGGQLLPAAAAPLRRPAGREGRPVHRVRRRRRQAHADADQRPAGVQPGRPGRAASGCRSPPPSCWPRRRPTWPRPSAGRGAEIEAGELPAVLAEPTLLTAVFQNLLSNAIKFRGERAPRVAVTAERDGDFWLFAVADNGIGISSRVRRPDLRDLPAPARQEPPTPAPASAWP